jgi:hypothetical protein
MSQARQKKEAIATVRCAGYTRKSTEEGLDQEFNTLDAQRESAESWNGDAASLRLPLNDTSRYRSAHRAEP